MNDRLVIGQRNITAFKYRLPFVWKHFYRRELEKATRFLPMFVTKIKDKIVLSKEKMSDDSVPYNIPKIDAYLNLDVEILAGLKGKNVQESISLEGVFYIEPVKEKPRQKE